MNEPLGSGALRRLAHKLGSRWKASSVLVAAAIASAASAEPEQWLQYHRSNSQEGYRWLELTTNAPTGVTLPKLGTQPFFARWATPLDAKGGRWICFDSTRKYGPPNRLYLDGNGNDRLDDEPPLDARQLDSSSASFAPARLVFKGEDGPLTYHLALHFIRYSEGDCRLLAWSGCNYDGQISLGGKKRSVRLVDGNVNGTFNDLAQDPEDCDRIVIEGDQGGERFLGQFFELGDQLYAIEVARDGAFLKVQPAKNVVQGQVRMPETIAEFTAVGAPGHFVRKPTQGELTLPAGVYRVHGWTIDRTDDPGAKWQLAGFGSSDLGSFEVTANQTRTLDVGEPVIAALTATENKGGASFGLRLKGRLGESVNIQKGGQRPRAPQLCLASAAGPFRATNAFEYG